MREIMDLKEENTRLREALEKIHKVRCPGYCECCLTAAGIADSALAGSCCPECGGHGFVSMQNGNVPCKSCDTPVLPHIGYGKREQHEEAIRQEEEDEESFNNGPFGVGA